MNSSPSSVVDFVKEEIRTRLEDGTFPDSRPLPGCRHLGKVFNAGHTAVSIAINQLVEEGLLERQLNRKVFPKPGLADSSGSDDANGISTIIALGTKVFGSNTDYYQHYLESFEKACSLKKIKFEFQQIEGLSLRSNVNKSIRELLFHPSVGVAITAPLLPHDIAMLTRQHVKFVVVGNYYSTSSPCLVENNKKTAEFFADISKKGNHGSAGCLFVSTHKHGERENMLFTEMDKIFGEKGILLPAKDKLALGQIDKEIEKKLINFFSKDHQSKIFLMGGDQIARTINGLSSRGNIPKDLEFVHYSDGENAGFDNTISLPIEPMAEKAIELLLDDQSHDKEILWFDPVMR